jgi:2-dehydropantoate 2-reductase
MKTLVIGAGAVGGYFGGRLLEAGQDVTFLGRPQRAARLAQAGLAIQSPAGNLHIPNPPTIQADAAHAPFDLIVLSCKAYDLEDAIRSFAPFVGPDTIILPLLNGMGHLDRLEAQFGAQAVLGGLCLISSTLDADGRILHLNDMHTIAFGERDGVRTDRISAIAAMFSGAKFTAKLSDAVMQEMWEKWVFIATLAGITCLMRASVGDIIAAGGGDLSTALLAECTAIAAAQGFPPSDIALQRNRTLFTTQGSPMTASMLRDIEGNGRTEAEHLLGDLMRRGEAQGIAAPLLRTAYLHVAAYEARQARSAKAG